MKHIKYDTDKYNFRPMIEDMVEQPNLEDLHKHQNSNELLKLETEQATPFHKLYYSKVRDHKFFSVYKSFIKKIIKPLFDDEEIVYQKIPTFRTQFVNNIGVGKWHRDKDYSHPSYESNFFLPVTDAYDTNTVWAESEVDKKDYSPITIKYGQCVMWDGANLRHGNKINETDITRVSFDFRCMKLSDYNKTERTEKQSIVTNMSLVIGQYYEVM